MSSVLDVVMFNCPWLSQWRCPGVGTIPLESKGDLSCICRSGVTGLKTVTEATGVFLY